MNATQTLLDWYDANKRVLPFRGTRDPYRVWVSEIMLQQTRTETVSGYFTRFIARFPDVETLARADEQEVLKYWEGLGYYSRAKNLLRAARMVTERFGGQMPRTLDELRALPGVGAYTAAAVASIAYDVPAPAIDGNLTRVIARLFGLRENMRAPSAQRILYERACALMPNTRAGEMNQALMDLGATVCTPGTPDCARCPLRDICDAYAAGDADELPVLPQKTAPKQVGMTVLLALRDGCVLVSKRREKLLGGLYVFYLMEDITIDAARAARLRGLDVTAVQRLGKAKHVFTHRVWNMDIFVCRIKNGAPLPEGTRLVAVSDLKTLPMPTAMRAPGALLAEYLDKSKKS